MTRGLDNETWLLDAGGAVIEQQAAGRPLSDADRLVYCLWVADYSMRNAGDLATARDLSPGFQREAVALAVRLRLPVTRAAFERSAEALQSDYAQRFDRICDEIRAM